MLRKPYKVVVYYSRSGNAKFVAETIAKELGSEIEETVDLRIAKESLDIFQLATMLQEVRKPR
jgi:flavodoxin